MTNVDNFNSHNSHDVHLHDGEHSYPLIDFAFDDDNHFDDEQYDTNVCKINLESSQDDCLMPQSNNCICIDCFENKPVENNDSSLNKNSTLKKRRKKVTNTEEFIRQSKEKFGNKFDYSETKYIGPHVRIKLILNGEIIYVMPNEHLNSLTGCEDSVLWKPDNQHIQYNCTKYSKPRGHRRPKTQEQFIAETKALYGDKYDLSLVYYVNAETYILVICRTHGIFQIKPSSFLKGHGCLKCYYDRLINEMTLTREEFIIRANAIWGEGTYLYDRVVYIDYQTPVEIFCPIHQKYFWKRPSAFLRKREPSEFNPDGMPEGCIYCSREKVSQIRTTYTQEEFIAECEKLHNAEFKHYDYSNTKFISLNRHITYWCNVCQKEVTQLAFAHLKMGRGCQTCGYKITGEKQRYTTEQFIEAAQKLYGDYYSYEQTVYTYSDEKVIVICPEHGPFEITPNSHLCGHGCPKHHQPKLEKAVEEFLKDKFNYKYQQHFEWMGQKSLDFYLPDYNIGIECQGVQHFESVEYFDSNKKDGFENRRYRDTQKLAECKEHNVKLLYFTTDTKYDTFLDEPVYHTLDDLLDAINHIIENDNLSIEPYKPDYPECDPLF